MSLRVISNVKVQFVITLLSSGTLSNRNLDKPLNSIYTLQSHPCMYRQDSYGIFYIIPCFKKLIFIKFCRILLFNILKYFYTPNTNLKLF